MISLDYAIQEMARIKSNEIVYKDEPAKLRRNKNQYTMIRTVVIPLLESEIDPESLKRQLQEVERKISICYNLPRFNEWKSNTQPTSWGKDPLKTYKEMLGFKHLKIQREALKFILSQ